MERYRLYQCVTFPVRCHPLCQWRQEERRKAKVVCKNLLVICAIYTQKIHSQMASCAGPSLVPNALSFSFLQTHPLSWCRWSFPQDPIRALNHTASTPSKPTEFRGPWFSLHIVCFVGSLEKRHHHPCVNSERTQVSSGPLEPPFHFQAGYQ